MPREPTTVVKITSHNKPFLEDIVKSLENNFRVISNSPVKHSDLTGDYYVFVDLIPSELGIQSSTPRKSTIPLE